MCRGSIQPRCGSIDVPGSFTIHFRFCSQIITGLSNRCSGFGRYPPRGESCRDRFADGRDQLVAKQDVPWAKFKRLRTQLGAPKAITAMAHHLARLVYRMLKYGQEYVDKGMEYYQRKYRDQQIKIILRKAKDLGLTATLTPATVAG